jgi:hypothetical protein
LSRRRPPDSPVFEDSDIAPLFLFALLLKECNSPIIKEMTASRNLEPGACSEEDIRIEPQLLR